MDFYQTMMGKQFYESVRVNIHKMREAQEEATAVQKARLEEQKKTNDLLAEILETLKYLR